jgi:hypothetical protein
VDFKVDVDVKGDGKHETVSLWALIGPAADAGALDGIAAGRGANTSSISLFTMAMFCSVALVILMKQYDLFGLT